MKILVIEDDINKWTAISDFLQSYNGIEFSHQASYHTGMRALTKDNFDLLLLDMSMPVYDMETDARPLALAGRDILFQLRRRKISIQVIVMTQYEDFDGLSLLSLDRELQKEFPQLYKGFVYYNLIQDSWKETLYKLL